MNINKDFLVGFLSGTVVGAVGYRVYEQNKGQLCNLIQPMASPYDAPTQQVELTKEELLAQKEQLEDMIAEQELE
ncbi:MAG: hypothetical protein ACI35P_13290 [Bacillus sp. (in: firmicutes)]